MFFFSYETMRRCNVIEKHKMCQVIFYQKCTKYPNFEKYQNTFLLLKIYESFIPQEKKKVWLLIVRIIIYLWTIPNLENNSDQISMLLYKVESTKELEVYLNKEKTLITLYNVHLNNMRWATAHGVLCAKSIPRAIR